MARRTSETSTTAGTESTVESAAAEAAAADAPIEVFFPDEVDAEPETVRTFERDGATRTAGTEVDAVNLRADGWTEKTSGKSKTSSS